MESSAAGGVHNDQFLFVRINLGAEGRVVVVESDGAVEFLSGEWICLCVLAGKSRDLLQCADRSHGVEQCAGDQREWQVVADVPAFPGELVRSVWGVRARGERSSGVREHGTAL